MTDPASPPPPHLLLPPPWPGAASGGEGGEGEAAASLWGEGVGGYDSPLPFPDLPLPDLTNLLGPDGTSVALLSRLRQAEDALALQRRAWLRCDALRRAVLQDPALEQAWTAAELRRGGHPAFAAAVPPPPPHRQDPLPALGRRLCQQSAELAAYYRPAAGDDVTGGDDDVTAGTLRALREERRQLEAAQQHQGRLGRQLEQQRGLYAQVLLRCRALLERLAGPGIAGAWGELDGRHGQYLRAKATAVLLKIRKEELQVLLDTYSPEKLDAHRRIRAGLEGALRQAKEEAAAAKATLEELRGLGPDFAQLAAEYGELRQRLRQRRWDMEQLRRQQNR